MPDITVDPPGSTRYACGLTFGEMKLAVSGLPRCVREIEYEPETGGRRVEQCPNEGTFYHVVSMFGLDGYVLHLCQKHSEELEIALNDGVSW